MDTVSARDLDYSVSGEQSVLNEKLVQLSTRLGKAKHFEKHAY